MSSRVDSKPPQQAKADPPKRAPGPGSADPRTGRFDKAFPIWLEGERGVSSGIARNVTESGMFVETREPFPLGTRVRVTFATVTGNTEMTLEAEVRYQCFINFSKPDASRAGMRGIGLKFVAPGKVPEHKGTLH